MAHLSFEQHVTAELAKLEERTRDLPEIRKDVAKIASEVTILKTKASIFGAMAAAVLTAAVEGIKQFFGVRG